MQVLLLTQKAGVLKLGTSSLDGTKVNADASKRKAISYKRLIELETQLQAEVEELFALSEKSEQSEVPDGLVVSNEIALRQDRLARLAEAKVVETSSLLNTRQQRSPSMRSTCRPITSVSKP